MNDWTLIEGDALDSLRALEPESVQCCVTSPPYFGLRDYKVAVTTWGDGWTGCLGLEPSPEQYVAHLVEVFAEVWRVLRADGTLWLVIADSYSRSAGPRSGNFGRCARNIGIPEGHQDSRRRFEGIKDKDLLLIPAMTALALRAAGWYVRKDIIWDKPNGMCENVTDRPTNVHEYVFLLSRSERYRYDAAAIREPDKGTDRPRRTFHQPEPSGGLHAPHRGIRRRDGRNGEGRNKRSVWTVATQPYPEAHFATFPPKLIEPMVLAGCPRGGVVLDPFAGTGTTLQVAVANGRSTIGIELNPEYAELARKRLAGVTPSMFDSGSA